MNLRESIKLVQASKPIFGTAFYDRLFAAHPDLREFFRHTTIEHQAAIFTMQLSVLEAFYVDRSEAAGMYLKLLGTKHKDRGIPDGAYPQFRNVLLESLESFLGDAWTADLGRLWREALDSSITQMLEGYQERFQL